LPLHSIYSLRENLSSSNLHNFLSSQLHSLIRSTPYSLFTLRATPHFYKSAGESRRLRRYERLSYLEFGSCPDLSFWIIIYRKIVDPAKRESLGFGSRCSPFHRFSQSPFLSVSSRRRVFRESCLQFVIDEHVFNTS